MIATTTHGNLNHALERQVYEMKIIWVTQTTGRAYVNGNLVAYAHRDSQGNVTYNSRF